MWRRLLLWTVRTLVWLVEIRWSTMPWLEHEFLHIESSALERHSVLFGYFVIQKLCHFQHTIALYEEHILSLTKGDSNKRVNELPIRLMYIVQVDSPSWVVPSLFCVIQFLRDARYVSDIGTEKSEGLHGVWTNNVKLYETALHILC